MKIKDYWNTIQDTIVFKIDWPEFSQIHAYIHLLLNRNCGSKTNRNMDNKIIWITKSTINMVISLDV